MQDVYGTLRHLGGMGSLMDLTVTLCIIGYILIVAVPLWWEKAKADKLANDRAVAEVLREVRTPEWQAQWKPKPSKMHSETAGQTDKKPPPLPQGEQ